MGLLPKSRKARARMMVVAVAAPVLALAVGLSLFAMRNAVDLFYGPTEAEAKATPGQVIRIGGLVLPGSVVKSPDGVVVFAITDNATAVKARFSGDLPDLFSEGQGVVVRGSFDKAKQFQAEQVLAKHDEKYMPREVVEALKSSGEWQRGQTPG